tara:strand:+ start:49 stop:1848 length:1800 start_codon:yes stop_codon:yes gene_type:complete
VNVPLHSLDKKMNKPGIENWGERPIRHLFQIFWKSIGQRKKIPVWAGCVLAIYLSPYLILGQDAHVRIHDDIGAKFVMLKLLAESGQIFGQHDTIIPNILNGIPRGSMGTEFNVMLWMVYFFGPFPAYVLNKIFIHTIALFGMYRLLAQHLLGKDMKLLALGVSLAFAVLPFYAPMELSVVAQPLVLHSFLSIRRGTDRWADWLIIGLIPFYSSLYYAFFWFILSMSLIWAYDLLVKNQFNKKFFGAIAMMSTVFLLVEYRHIYMLIFDSDFTSVRTDFWIPEEQSLFYGIYKIIIDALKSFTLSGSFNNSLQTIVILPAAIIGHFILFDRRLKEYRLPFLFVLTFLSCLGYATYRSGLLTPLKEKFYFIKVFYPYFITLEPLLWFVIFALSLGLIVNHARMGTLIALVLISLQVLYGFFYHDEIQKLRKPSYREFYAVDLFKQISAYIGKSQDTYRVVSVGLHPAISLYNGFYTLDGYYPNYPIAHKRAFRKIIIGEIKKSSRIQSYFDDYGARCYVFAAELELSNWLYTKHENGIVEHLDFNTQAFMNMGGEYIISSVEIKNYSENNWEFLKIFEDDASVWRIYLYRANEIDSVKLP